jgi:hypothetical protein
VRPVRTIVACKKVVEDKPPYQLIVVSFTEDQLLTNSASEDREVFF